MTETTKRSAAMDSESCRDMFGEVVAHQDITQLADLINAHVVVM